MSGMSSDDAESEHALILNENAIAAARALLPSGPTSIDCHECGEEIPKDRRKAQPGCKLCIFCQELEDKKPRQRIRMLDRIL